MKLLTDFDGVWTDPRAEGLAQGEFMDRTLIEWARESSRSEVAEWIAEARKAALAEPTRHGWAPGGGRLSAFADEDPFAPHSAFLHVLGRRAASDPTARMLLDSIRGHGFQDLDSFGGHAHARGVEQVAAVRGPGILPAAADAGRSMARGGIQLVVVSNSGPAKLERWFGHAGLSYTLHPETKPDRLRLRGGARKFLLGEPPPEPIAIGPLRIEVARPHYDEALREERPDAVVGDVFSLDLALPLWLRRNESDWSKTRLFWLAHPYTPAWLRREIESHAPEVETFEGGLPAVAEALLGGSRSGHAPRS